MKSRFLAVAQSGKTVDGREITPAQIDQMAASYNPKTYGARVNIEHLISAMPDGIFSCVGDVVAAKAVDGPNGSRVLQAQFDAKPEMVRLAETRQKVFFSIEIYPNFAGTGQAYLGGVAMTDSPASLGTDMLTFAIKSDKASARLKDHLFSTSLESSLELETPPSDPIPSLMAKVKDLLSGKGKTDDARFAKLEEAITAIAEDVGAVKSAAPGTDAVTKLAADLAKLQTDLAALTTKLSTTPASSPRPAAAGTGANQTDC